MTENIDKKLERNKILMFLAKVKWYVWLGIVIVALSITWAILDSIWVAEIEEEGNLLHSEIQTILKNKYGDLGSKTNGWQFILDYDDLVDISDLSEDEEYQKSSISQKTDLLNKKDAFNRIRGLNEISEYDVIVPPFYIELDVDELFVEDLFITINGFGKPNPKSIASNVSSQLNALLVCSRLLSQRGDLTEVLDFIRTTGLIADKIPSEDSGTLWIKLDSLSFMRGMLNSVAAKLPLEMLLQMDEFSAERFFINAKDWIATDALFERYYIYAVWKREVIKNYIRKKQGIPNYKLSILYNRQFVTAFNDYKQFSDIFCNTESEANMTLLDFFEDQCRPKALHLVTNMYLPSRIKVTVGPNEENAENCLSILYLKSRIFYQRTGAMPDKIASILKFGTPLKIEKTEDDDKIDFLGYRFGIYQLSEKQKGDLGVKMALWAYPKQYGVDGESSYIMLDNKLYYLDLGSQEKIPDFPDSKGLEVWERLP